jgi:hypothetical protein
MAITYISKAKPVVLWTTLVILLSAAPFKAPAQVIPSMRVPPGISLFGTYTAVKPDYQYYGDLAVSGGTLGGFVQTRHIAGLELRGSIVKWGGLEHQESILGGPRFSMHFGRFAPYVCVLGGGANAWRWETPPPKTGKWDAKLVEGFGPQWSTIGGLDIHLQHHFVIRLGELSYSKTYLKNWTMTPLGASVGIVYRIN